MQLYLGKFILTYIQLYTHILLLQCLTEKMRGVEFVFVLIYMRFVHGLSGELSAIESLLHEQSDKNKYVHMVEYGCYSSSISTVIFGRHEAIVSWSKITDNPRDAEELRSQYEGSHRISVKVLPGDFAIWNRKLYDELSEEGTASEYESYVSELMYFGAKDNYPYWLANFGRARVDVALAALALLSRTGGLMFISDWASNECFAETLLQFYDLVDMRESVAILSPKDIASIELIWRNGYIYNWCFSWQGNKKVVRYSNGPSDTNGVLSIIQSNSFGCVDVFGDFYCDDDGSNCLSCYAAMASITKRGMLIRGTIKKVVTARDDASKEL